MMPVARALSIVDETTLNIRVVNALYLEAMVLADEARSYFDSFGHGDRDLLRPMERVSFSCESLKVTTRLMHVIAWLLTQRSIAAGEMRYGDALSPSLRLGNANASDEVILAALPSDARALVEASTILYLRVKRLDDRLGKDAAVVNAPLHLRRKLAGAF
jgi:regulator of CtrA degradation